MSRTAHVLYVIDPNFVELLLEKRSSKYTVYHTAWECSSDLKQVRLHGCREGMTWCVPNGDDVYECVCLQRWGPHHGPGAGQPEHEEVPHVEPVPPRHQQ